MPSTAPQSKAPETVEDYLAGWDDDEDPFASPPPEISRTKASDNANGKKRKSTDALGIDEEIDLKKKPRAPRVKLDETRLLSEKGIPKLRKMATGLKLKNKKGHEFSDVERLLCLYQDWLDDLFPKATFMDAFSMVEKLGHKTIIRNERLKWIEEFRPKSKVDDDDENLFGEKQSSVPTQPTRLAPIFDETASGGGRATTPENNDLFVNGDDIYDATPRARPPKPADEPDDEDLMALMAEQEASAPPFRSIFGNGTARKAAAAPTFREPDQDELDALMAEAELSQSSKPAQPRARKSIFGNGTKEPPKPVESIEFDDDLDALMAEAEGEQRQSASTAPAPTVNKPGSGAAEDGDDDLDALMAEAEGISVSKPKDMSQDRGQDPSAEDEEAMAEMEGLW